MSIMKMFRAALDELFEQQRVRLTTVAGPERVASAFAALAGMNLDAESIDKRCCLELQQILTKKYEDPIASSRLAGYGWTTAHVKDHMRRFLQSRVQHAGQVMRSYINGDHDDLEHDEMIVVSEDEGPDAEGPDAEGPVGAEGPDAFASNMDALEMDV